MLARTFSFRFRLTATIFLVAVGATLTGLIYYYQVARAQIWTQMSSRVKDFGNLGVSLFSTEDLRYLQGLDTALNSAQMPAAQPPGLSGPMLSAPAENEKIAMMRAKEHRVIVQKLRRLRDASGRTAVHETTPAAEPGGAENHPQMHRAWIAGVRMHQSAPMHLRVLAGDELGETNGQHERSVGAHQRLYRIGDIFRAQQQTAVAAALSGEVTVGNDYRTESSGIYISGYAPLRDSRGAVLALLIIDFSAATEFDALFRLRVTGYYVIVGVLLLSIAAASTASRLLLKPLEAMQNAAERIGQRDFSLRIETSSSDELANLACAMNLMAQELGEYSSLMERRVAARTREIAGILGALDQGVLTIDRNGIIQAEYSAATLAIFGLKEIAHRPFSELFSDPKIRSAAERYVELFFSGKEISSQMLDKANPLRQIIYRNAMGEARHLRFSFRTLADDGDGRINRLLVTVVDDTSDAILQEKIHLAESEKRAELDALINLMRLPAPVLEAFMRQQKDFLQDAKQLISVFGSDSGLVASFASATHALKGNALQLGFLPLAEQLHELEDYLLRAGPAGDSETRFLRHEISRCVNSCESLIMGRDRLVSRMRDLVGETLPAPGADGLDELRHFWLHQIHRKAAENSVAASVEVAFGKGTGKALHSLHNVIVQLLRNTFAHGIEEAHERRAKGKAEQTHIYLAANRAADTVEVTYREDGRGIAGLPPGQGVPAGQILQKGLTSPHKFATLEYGRGMGIEFIVSSVRALGGSVTVNTSQKETTFLIVVPA